MPLIATEQRTSREVGSGPEPDISPANPPARAPVLRGGPKPSSRLAFYPCHGIDGFFAGVIQTIFDEVAGLLVQLVDIEARAS